MFIGYLLLFLVLEFFRVTIFVTGIKGSRVYIYMCVCLYVGLVYVFLVCLGFYRIGREGCVYYINDGVFGGIRVKIRFSYCWFRRGRGWV